MRFLQGLSDNHLLVIHNLYYIGNKCLSKILIWKNATDRILQFKRSAGVICRCEVNKFNTHMDRSDLIGTLMEKKPEMVFRFVKGCFEMCNKDLASLRE